ncbi:MAG TPA: phosphoglycerate mutase family protein [Actinomycetota bacterium]|nr:phosphoglycerate mutase family protein [Actinomycetota bacterium]
MRTLELRRHGERDPEADRLSAEGRARAEDLGRRLGARWDVVFVSPAQRAAETAAWILRGAGAQPRTPEVVPGLLGAGEEDRTPDRLAAAVSEILSRVPAGGRGLAIGHTPLIERAVLGLTGTRIAPLRELEGVLLVEGDDGGLRVEELRDA